ncbi:hypothetical protein GGR58DRAFT_403915 [Xylaria digitata]|nr:hypothetical protein GGR58DRAFT_403915 [Xylaria digitata]
MAITALPCRSATSGNLWCYSFALNALADYLKYLVQSIFALQILYPLAVGFVKISITAIFMRIFPSRKFRLACIVVISLSTAWMLRTILVDLLVCNPPEKNWNSDAPRYCGNQTATFVAVGVMDATNEICLFVLPLPMLFKLHLSRRYRVTLACAFSTGVMYGDHFQSIQGII